MKRKIKATYKEKTFEFCVYENTWWMKPFKKYVGITLSSNHVFLTKSFEQTCKMGLHIIGHEAIHVYQARLLGWKFIPVYLWKFIKHGFDYNKNPMEVEAYKYEKNVRWETLTQ
jgi:hypothetical protein